MNQPLLDSWTAATINYYGFYGDKKNRSISTSVIAKYSSNKNWRFRFEAGITSINLSSYYSGVADTFSAGQGHVLGTSDVIVTMTIKQRIYRFNPGFEVDLANLKRLTLYVGNAVSVQIVDKMHWRDSVNSGPFDPYRSNVFSSTTQGGFTLGLQSFLGVKAQLTKKFFFGGEISYLIGYYNIGGLQEGTLTAHYPTTPDEFMTWSIHQNNSSGLLFSKIMPSFFVSFRI